MFSIYFTKSIVRTEVFTIYRIKDLKHIEALALLLLSSQVTRISIICLTSLK